MRDHPRALSPIGLAYGLAVAAYFGLYALVFLGGGVDLTLAALGGVANTLPPALLAPFAFRAYRRADWPPGPRALVPLVHGASALAFVALCVGAWWGIFVLADRLYFHRPPQPFQVRVALWQGLLTLVVFTLVATAGRAVGARDSLIRERARATEAEALRARAELAALRARLDPHFLFNTLHTVLALLRRDPAAAEEALEELGALLRASLEADDGESRTVREEWRLTESYLTIERLRLGSRLRVEARIDDAAAEARLPALTLQPLVENAVRHAVAARAEGGSIRIAAHLRDGALELVVADDGPGLDAPAARPGGRGLRLVTERLAVFTGGRGDLQLASPPGGGTVVTLRLPQGGG